MTGYRALHESSAWIDISDRGRIKVTGQDRLHFMHAMSTNDIEKLSPGEGIETLFLNGQGHIQADVRVLIAEDHLLLDCDSRRRETLPLHLNKFIVMDDVSLEDVGSTLPAIAVEGPRAEDVAAHVTDGALPPPGALRHATHGATRIARSSLTGGPGLWFFPSAGEKDAWIRRLESAGAVPADEQAWQTVRVENGIPLEGVDYPDKTIPQQAARLDAVSFTKGCYLGQEIVERVRSRGNLRRTLERLEVDSEQLPPPDSPIFLGEKEVGRLTSPVFSPTMGRVLGFALLRSEAPPGETLTVDGHEARVRR